MVNQPELVIFLAIPKTNAADSLKRLLQSFFNLFFLAADGMANWPKWESGNISSSPPRQLLGSWHDPLPQFPFLLMNRKVWTTAANLHLWRKRPEESHNAGPAMVWILSQNPPTTDLLLYEKTIIFVLSHCECVFCFPCINKIVAKTLII